MPEMNGRAVIDRAQTCQPELKAVLITGYAEALRTGGISAIPLLAKPFKVAELSRRIAEILRGSSSELSADGHNSVR
jgi:CheY-like chemotaxis protein